MLQALNETLHKVAIAYTEALKAALSDRLVSVVLFGSVARGEATPFSDTDLLVVAKGLPKGRFARKRECRMADQSVEGELMALHDMGAAADICVIIQTPEEARRIRPLYLDFVKDAVILYDEGEFFAQILAQLKHSLERLGVHRLRLGKVRCWDLKPDLAPGEILNLSGFNLP